jgi:hypothetical protein
LSRAGEKFMPGVYKAEDTDELFSAMYSAMQQAKKA